MIDMTNAVEAGRALFKLIDSTVKGTGMVQDAITAIVSHYYSEEGKGTVGMALVEAAQRVERKYPVSKGEDGKDRNRDARNARLSLLRTQLRRAAKTLGVDPLTVKLVDGVWQVVVVEPAPPASDDGKAEGGKGGKADETNEADADDALWSAVELVLENLSQPAVLSAIRSGLEAMAKPAR